MLSSHSFFKPLHTSLALLTILKVALVPVLCHDYIKYWSPDDGKTFELGHKQPLAKTALRDVSENTGWIGSKFLTHPAITCGSSSTPSQRIASPGGHLFSDANQSAGKTMAVRPGASVHLIVADDPGKGFPHDNGHIQTYLGYCGETNTACQDFDAASIPYFKIQGERDALSNKSKFPMNKARDGNEWAIPIPNNLPKGSYILRSEIIALNQGTQKEGKQDQYYVTCGQIYLSDPTSPPVSLSQMDTVKFPGAYVNGKLDPKKLPGPEVFKFNSESEDTKTAGRVASNSPDKLSNDQSPTATPLQRSPEVRLAFTNSTPQCADTCLKKKFQTSSLSQISPSPNCQGGREQDLDCICNDEGRIQTFINCARDECQVKCEAESVINEFYSKCKLPIKIHCGPQRMDQD